MANKIILKKSSVVGKEPLVTDLDYGELALNYADGRLYFKTADNQIDSFATGGGGSGTVTEAFRSIAVPGQSSIIADTATDTLTIRGTGVIGVLTDPATDTLTITTNKSFPFVKSNGVESNIPLRTEASLLTTTLETVYLPFIKVDGTSVTTLKLVA